MFTKEKCVVGPASERDTYKFDNTYLLLKHCGSVADHFRTRLDKWNDPMEQFFGCPGDTWEKIAYFQSRCLQALGVIGTAMKNVEELDKPAGQALVAEVTGDLLDTLIELRAFLFDEVLYVYRREIEDDSTYDVSYLLAEIPGPSEDFFVASVAISFLQGLRERVK